MEYDVFTDIEEYYMNNHRNIVDVSTTKEEDNFYNELINPVYEYNPKAGIELESKFLLAEGAVQKQSFRNGFKVGIHFILECLGK